ncbi:MAG: hypothetical protein ACI97A_000918 [Planctomycetota bacterium]|jgi:hypothetical protein
MKHSPRVPVTRPLPTNEIAEFLSEHRASVLQALGGMSSFPMRPVGRLDDVTRQHEEHVQRRFEAEESNLFGLCIDPQHYLGRPGRERDEALYGLFILGRSMSNLTLRKTFGDQWIDRALSEGLLWHQDLQDIRSHFRLVPHGNLLFLAEHYCSESDMVYLSNDSLFMAQYLADKYGHSPEFSHVVDLGIGSGLLACSLASKWGVSASGVDINSRAVAFAEANGMINGIDGSFSVKSYDEASIPEGSFVVANPPFVFMPDANGRAIHSDGGKMGMELTLQVMQLLNDKLPANGVFAVMTQSVCLDATQGPHLLDAITGLCPRLDVEVENVGSMPILSKFEEFYVRQGVTGLNQLIITGRNGDGHVTYQAENRFESEFCFG